MIADLDPQTRRRDGFDVAYMAVWILGLFLAMVAVAIVVLGVVGAATETLTWQRSHRQPRRIILVAYNAATYKAYQSALAAAGQPVEPSTSAIFAPLPLGLPPAAAH